MNWRIGCCFSTPRRSLRPEALAVRGDRLDYFRYADLNEAARAADASREAKGAVYGERLK